jgi:hypothetical protein
VINPGNLIKFAIHNGAVTNTNTFDLDTCLITHIMWACNVYAFIYLIAHLILKNGGIIYNITTVPVS